MRHLAKCLKIGYPQFGSMHRTSNRSTEKKIIEHHRTSIPWLFYWTSCCHRFQNTWPNAAKKSRVKLHDGPIRIWGPFQDDQHALVLNGTFDGMLQCHLVVQRLKNGANLLAQLWHCCVPPKNGWWTGKNRTLFVGPLVQHVCLMWMWCLIICLRHLWDMHI